jgi:hypothetical protein
LKKLVDNGLFSKATYSAHPNRFEYRLTPKGRDLYPMIVLLMQWGDRWITEPAGEAELRLVHHCGRRGPFPLRCPGCQEPIEARGTIWTIEDTD